MAVQRTLVLIKPDAVRRGLAGAIISRYEHRGLHIVTMDLRTLDAATADQHYVEHVGKAWYPELRTFITSGPLVALMLEGDEAVSAVRSMNGATDARQAAAGTIRGDWALSNQANLVHASDSPQAAQRELALFFPGL